MISSGHSGPTIFACTTQRKGYNGSLNALAERIHAVAKNHFDGGIDCDLDFSVKKKTAPGGQENIPEADLHQSLH